MTVTQTTAARDSVFTAVQAAKDNNYYPCFYNSLLLVKSRHTRLVPTEQSCTQFVDRSGYDENALVKSNVIRETRAIRKY